MLGTSRALPIIETASHSTIARVLNNFFKKEVSYFWHGIGSLPNFEENMDEDDDDDDNDDDEFQDENDEQKGFEQTIQFIKKGNIDREIKIITQNKGNGTIQVYDAPTFSCIQNLQPFVKYYLRRKAVAEAQTRKLNRTLNTLISMSSKKAKIRKNVKNKKHTF